MAAKYGKVPFLEYDFIRQKAGEFLQRFECNSRVCPIEEIVDVKLDINIIPTEGLYKNHGASGILSHDFSTINVDKSCSENYEEKFCFTLAHEIGHIELHADIYNQLSFESVTQWPDYIFQFFTSEEYSWLERQADMFAGLVLVPKKFLLEDFTKYANPVCEELLKADLNTVAPEEIFKVALQEISHRIAPKFLVSPKTIEARLFYDGLQKKLRSMLAK